MYQNIAILAVFLLLYSTIAGAVDRSWVSGPIVFCAVGVALGPIGLDLVRLNVAAEGLRLLAEATLAIVLFTDAANAHLAVLRRHIGLSERLLLIGLPLTILLGFAVAWVIFPGMPALELALLATMLAPTDAALGRPVVANPSVPAVLRESLNLESGLNDGICVPVLVILLSFAVGTQIEGDTIAHVARVVAEEIGIGLAVGLALTAAAVFLIRAAGGRGWTSEAWQEVQAVALAGACFAVAQELGGSGFIACFTGGLLLGRLMPREKHVLLRGAEGTGEALALLTWMVFGAVVIGQLPGRITAAALVYAMLSLTIIRMVPVFLCLRGSGVGFAESLFVGWFGPRGLASIVFAIMIYDAQLPGNETLMVTAACAVVLSVIAHGMTANPLTRALAARSAISPHPGEAIARPRSE